MNILRALMWVSGLVAMLRRGKKPVAAGRTPRLPYGALAHAGPDAARGLSSLQTEAKSRIDRALDAGRSVNIYLPRRSGATHLAHVVHRERGGVVVLPHSRRAKEFQRDHFRMFGERANVACGHPDRATMGTDGPLIMDGFHEEDPLLRGRPPFAPRAGAAALWAEH